MNYRRSIAAIGLAGAIALAAACGTEDKPAVRAQVSPDLVSAWQYYYEVTHPQVPSQKFNGDAKDHVGFGQQTETAAGPQWPGDAKDHPNYGGKGGAPGWPGDAKDHEGYVGGGPVVIPAAWGDAKDHPGYGQSEQDSGVQALLTADRPSQNPIVSFQAELAELAQLEGLTGLSPAFLQPVPELPTRTLIGNPR